jgi:hypothetical protein
MLMLMLMLLMMCTYNFCGSGSERSSENGRGCRSRPRSRHAIADSEPKFVVACVGAWQCGHRGGLAKVKHPPHGHGLTAAYTRSRSSASSTHGKSVVIRAYATL